jgi:hypothetical protein
MVATTTIAASMKEDRRYDEIFVTDIDAIWFIVR